jgi:hypothetical protein
MGHFLDVAYRVISIENKPLPTAKAIDKYHIRERLTQDK